jgi:metal transporter CNNM
MNHSPLLSNISIWIGIAFCITQSAIFSGLNLAIFSIIKLRLEVEAAGGNRDAVELLAWRQDSNLTLATVLLGQRYDQRAPHAAIGYRPCWHRSVCLLDNRHHAVRRNYSASLFLAKCAPHGVAPHALLKVYQVGLFPLAKPTAILLNWWLGPEGITLLRERDFRAFITKHVGAAGADMGQLEAIGALNFLDLDDILVLDEGESIDPPSVITLPIENERPSMPKFERSPDDPFLRRLNASGKKWLIIVDNSGRPSFVLDAHHFLRDSLFNTVSVELVIHWHRPIIVTNMHTPLGSVIGHMKVKPEHPEDDVIDNDLILVWGEQKRIITGADLLGRLLRGIVTHDANQN